MAVGDVNSTARGSGARYNDGKPDWSIMPTHLLEEVVRVWEYGAKKYARYNWAKGMAWSVPYSCIVRHLYAWWWKGERNDPESGYSHLAHIVCNVMMLLHFETQYKEGDDRPKEFHVGGYTSTEGAAKGNPEVPADAPTGGAASHSGACAAARPYGGESWTGYLVGGDPWRPW